MLSQCWVTIGDSFLAAVAYEPVNSQGKTGAVLISGFSQPMCDNDFFMARLARRLAGEGLYVLQVDPRGHGDSPGCLEEVTLETLRLDLRCAVQYAGERWGGKIFGIGKGLSATLLAEERLNQALCGVAGINPYCLDPAAVKDLFPDIRGRVVDTSDILTGTDFKRFTDFDQDLMAFFEALGAGLLLNLLGQKVSREMLRELMSYEPAQVLRMNPEARFWLTPDKCVPEGMIRWTPEGYRTLEEYRQNSFPGDPGWHHRAIENVCAWITQKKPGMIDSHGLPAMEANLPLIFPVNGRRF